MRWQWIVAALAIGSLVLLAQRMQSIRMPPRSYRAAVMQVLDDRQIAYHEISLENVCPPTPGCYGSSMPSITRVTVYGQEVVYGQMVCTRMTRRRDFWTQCTLSLPNLDLRDVQLQPLASEIPWLMWLEHAWRTVRSW